MIRKTKIVCTLGPASDSEEMISKLMDAGMNVCRLNMSHGSYEEQGARIDRIKRLRREKNIPVAIMLDTKGPEVRTKTLKGDKVTLQAGQEFILTSRDIEGDETQVAITYPRMVELVHPGNRILIDDGLIALDVKQITGGTDIVCSVVNGGVLGGRKGISVPDVDLQMPSIGEKDRSDIVFGIEKGIDLIAASFVCRPSDVLTLRKLCADNGGSHVQIFSKIENRMGVNNFDEILKVSDGIMVARGDLGVEVDMEEVPVLQKQFIHKCNVAAKPVITATQMLDSMIRNPRPTRAEASDVANAIIDGTDAIMLSGETAAGKYPIEAVGTMVRIATYIEAHQLHDNTQLLQQEAVRNATVRTVANAVSYSCCQMARDLNANGRPLPPGLPDHRPDPERARIQPAWPELRRCARAHGRERRHGRAHQHRRRSGAAERAGQDRRRGHHLRGRADRRFRHDQPHQGAHRRQRAPARRRRGQRLRERQRLHRQHAQRFGERL